MQSIAHRALSRARAFLVDVVKDGNAAACDAEVDRIRNELRLANAHNDALDQANTKHRDEIKSLTAELARAKKTQDAAAGLDIEPTWILAMWSVHNEGWTETKRGSYDSMVTEMRKAATPWNLFPRPDWDTLVRLGRAR